MNFATTFQHEERVFSYRFFGSKGKAGSVYRIEGLHFYVFTPAPLRITRKNAVKGAGRIQKMAPGSFQPAAFEDQFEVSCQDKLILKAFRESQPLQDLVIKIFSENAKSIEIREEVMVVTFENALPGRLSGKGNKIKIENPVDNEWVKNLKIKLLKLSQVVAGMVSYTPEGMKKKEEPTAGLVMAAFFAVALAFVATAFYVQSAIVH